MIVDSNEHNIALAVEYLKKGEAVALPTETVYGLAADATNAAAVKKIYQIKNRPGYNPLIVHAADIAMAEQYCQIDDISYELMKIFWPGPLTFVLPQAGASNISSEALAGLGSIAIRCPQNIFGEVIKRINVPLVAPSANMSGSISPTSALAVQESLKNRVKLIIDGGACAVGLESTIVKIQNEKIYILRHGGVSLEDLQKHTKVEIISGPPGTKIEAPGMLSSHYAPKALVRLNAREVYRHEALLAFGQQICRDSDKAVRSLNLSQSGDLKEAARNLFSFLHLLDGTDITTIAVQPIPDIGLGKAIRDRLGRAAAER